MYEYASTIVRGGVNAAVGFLQMIQRRALSWVQGDDLTFVIFLAFVALLALFVLVPNRRRY